MTQMHRLNFIIQIDFLMRFGVTGLLMMLCKPDSGCNGVVHRGRYGGNQLGDNASNGDTIYFFKSSLNSIVGLL